jgi:hypothetical protein
MLMYYFMIALINFCAFLFFFRHDTPYFYNKDSNYKSKKMRLLSLIEIHHFKNVLTELMIFDRLKSKFKPIDLRDLLTI